MSNTTLEIIQGLSQAAANAYDGSHDERFTYDKETLIEKKYKHNMQIQKYKNH